MPRGVNEVDQETRTILALLDEGQVVLRELIKQRNSSERKEELLNDDLCCPSLKLRNILPHTNSCHQCLGHPVLVCLTRW